MEKQVALAILDISGYTEFIKYNRQTLAHAHEAISLLLEGMADAAEFPLALNKFEGDAALLYADIGADPGAGIRDVGRQVFALFPAFRRSVASLARERSVCPCGACRNIGALRLKAVLHRGRAAFRRIRQFEEMGGEDVILLHRLLKNAVASREYVLATAAFAASLPADVVATGTRFTERYEHMGDVDLVLFDVAGQEPR